MQGNNHLHVFHWKPLTQYVGPKRVRREKMGETEKWKGWRGSSFVSLINTVLCPSGSFVEKMSN